MHLYLTSMSTGCPGPGASGEVAPTHPVHTVLVGSPVMGQPKMLDSDPVQVRKPATTGRWGSWGVWPNVYVAPEL